MIASTSLLAAVISKPRRDQSHVHNISETKIFRHIKMLDTGNKQLEMYHSTKYVKTHVNLDINLAIIERL